MAQVKTLLNVPLIAWTSVFLLLASCATPPTVEPLGYQPPYGAQPYAAPQNRPAVPPQQQVQALSAWIQQVEQQAIAEGVSPGTAHEALDNFVPSERVAELDQKQPESTVTFATYRHNTVTPDRIAKGADLMHRYADFLSAIEVRTGVPPQIVVALWAIESSYGQNMGNFETVNSLATLAYQGRRAAFFRTELIAALHILDTERMSAPQLRGSWAGAMGQCQFMPSTYLKYAVDGDGDGRRDIWNSPVDTLASIANYLAAEGWQRDLSWGREVKTANSSIDPSEAGMTQTRLIREWAEQGVVGMDGLPLSQPNIQASLLQPDGIGGSTFLAYDNIRALMRWNHSTYFALSVGLIADGIKKH
jgi:membrane-bound lytic murein transglycosylase B